MLVRIVGTGGPPGPSETRRYTRSRTGVARRPVGSEALRLNAKFLRNGIVMLVLVAGTVALLYTWVQSSTPSSQKGYSDFYGDVKAGNVSKVVQDGETLNVTTKDATYTVVVPNSITGDVYSDMQKAAAAGGQQQVPEYKK